MRPGRFLVAVDVGGTFTDAVAVSAAGGTLVAKVPSTPEDPAIAFEEALAELERAGLPLGSAHLVFHGTTVATNAMLTGRLARVVLVTTEGFADVLSYRNGTRPSVYDLQQPRPGELVARRDRVEARERLSSTGEVVTALEEAEIARVADEVAARRPEAVAVAFLFSYLDDRHEEQMAEALERRLEGVPVARSARLAREFREYPRTATAAVNAGLRPVVGRYLVSTTSRLENLGVSGRLMIMQSNGGCVPAARADVEAHRLLLSGPAAGVAGTVALGREYGIERLVSFDMGGTSLDVCLVADGTPPLTPTETIAGHPILCPSVDMVTIGAGGGSIAEVGPTGRLSVGPRSAGAQPGPAAYGRGGEEATVTDAHVVLGTLPTGLSLAGGLALDLEAARKVVGRVGEEMGLSLEEAADGIVQVSVAQMSLALRRVSVERGIDPEGYTLVAFGGAGPLHAGLLLRELRFGSVLVPRYPGLFAAAGLVSTDLRVDESRTVLAPLTEEMLPALAGWLRSTAEEMRARLADDGVSGRPARLVASADCRYVGQGYELAVPVSPLSEAALAELPERFAELHQRTYGHRDPDGTVEVVTLRLSAFGALPKARQEGVSPAGRSTASSAMVTTTSARLPGGAHRVDVPVYDRAALRSGHRFDGPAIVHQHDATTLVLERQSARVDRRGSLWIEEGR
ncbi:MAG TPA: hydantoinase/oxoprolinase family protein [Acidimicrobiales bacterium]|nr:hydantoinase/oxoprolinase family protein [Acidimicrobiales bacterium]